MSLANDTMEGRWLRELFKDECGLAGVEQPQLNSVIAALDVLIEGVDGLGFCLSEEGDTLSQWRGYGQDGTGVSIGFDMSFLSKGRRPSEKVAGYTLEKISYGDVSELKEFPSVVRSIVDSANDGAWLPVSLLTTPTEAAGRAELERKRKSANLPLFMLLGELFKVKNPAFSEEKEWRLLSLYLRSVNDIASFRAVQDRLVPFRQFDLPHKQEPIKKVILGPKNASNPVDIKNFLSMHGFHDVEVKKSSASYR